MFIIFEEVSEMQLVTVVLLLLALAIVADIDSASPPPSLTAVPVANLHAVVVEASALAESLDSEFRLALYSLHGEVEPGVASR